MNLPTIIILLIIVVALYFAFKHTKKSKGCDCGVDCSGCPGSCGDGHKN